MNIELADIELPARLAFRQPVSADDFWRLSQQNPELRLERNANGDLSIMSPTGLEGGGMELDVAAELRDWAIKDGRGKAYGSNSGVTLPDTSVRAADACWISWIRLNALTPAQRKRFAPVIPEFVIEVRSESDSLADLREKMKEWLANGIELAWLIDPSRKAVEIYRQSREPEVQEGHSAAYGEGSVGGFVLELGRIWG
jgi:Uma2 family endonuclease